MFVLTIDQRDSRADTDRVGDVLAMLNDPALATGRVRRFERTAGDEVQGVVEDPDLVVALALTLVREGHWSVGIGTGGVRQPLPRSARAGAGAAYEHARAAVERAKRSQDRVAVVGPDTPAVEQAEGLLALLSAIVQRRSAAGWEAVDLVAGGMPQTEAAARLGISKQALSQRLQAGWWPHETRVRPVAARLLGEADPELSVPATRMDP